MTGRVAFDLKYFKDLVRERTGLTFDSTREEILRQQVAEVMGQRGCRSRAELFALLRDDHGAFLDFVNRLTINETYFFREPQYLQLLTSHLVPELLAGKPPGEKIKIISAGCSTGEEPYSIAIALLESLGADAGRLFTVIGFDLNSAALEKAENGVYGKLSFRGVDEQFRLKYFEADRGDQFKLKAAVKELVRFTRFNLLSADYPSLFNGADVIFYRNVSIYFDPPTQRKILTGLASVLGEKGHVIFSSSETFSHQDIGGLALVENQGLFYFRKTGLAEDGVAENRAAALPRTSFARRRLGEGPALNGRTVPLGAKLQSLGAGRRSPSGGALGKTDSAGTSTGAKDSEALFRKAMDCFRMKDLGRASRLAEQLHSCECFRAKGYLLSGCILLNEERVQEAAEFFSRAVQADDLLLEAHMLLGLAAKKSGEDDKAIKCFHNALYIQDSCWLAHYYLAEIHLAGGNARKALGYYGTLKNILEKPGAVMPGLIFFPGAYSREDLLHLCRRKIAAMSEAAHGL